MNVNIRIAVPDDLPVIVKIYNQSIVKKFITGDLTPFTPEDKQSWFAAHPSNKHPIYVAEITNTVVGWLSLSAYRPGRKALAHVAEVSYYLDDNFQGQGIGSLLMEQALQQSPLLGFELLIAILIDGNQGSIGLLKNFGFAEWGRLPGALKIEGQYRDHLYYGRKI